MDQPSPNTNARLEAMPAELFEIIAQSVPASDLCSLRHTSASCAAKDYKICRKECFGTRKFLLSSGANFARLLDFLRSAPTVLSKTCHTLVIYLDDWKNYATGVDHMYKDLRANSSYFVSWHMSKQLVAVFAQMDELYICPEIIIKDRSTPDYHRLISSDEAALNRKPLSLLFQPCSNSDPRSIAVISQALKSSGINVAKISMLGMSSADLRYSFPVESLDRELGSGFKHLTTLKLNVWSYNNAHNHCWSFCNTLSHMSKAGSKLKHLELEMSVDWVDWDSAEDKELANLVFPARSNHYKWTPNRPLTHFLFAETYASLETLTLHGIWAKWRDFASFAERHKHLSKLKLHFDLIHFEYDELEQID